MILKLPDPDDLAGLAWYYWRAVEAVRAGDATTDEKCMLLAELERQLRAARGLKSRQRCRDQRSSTSRL